VATEITQIYKQLRAAQIREAIAEREWHNHQQQIRNAEEIERFLTDPKTGKTSQQALYTWLRREVRGLYSQCFQFAFEVAKKAERALQHELGDPNRTFLQYGYQSGKEGLLAGERLYLDVRRMELAYHELNRREYELTRHVSLRQLDPKALLALRATGQCTVTLPEELFDLDCSGHHFRRLRSVAVSGHGVDTSPRSGSTLEVGEHGADPAVVVGGRRQVELGEDVVDVLGDGGVRHGELAGDGRVGPAFGHVREDLAFAVGEPLERGLHAATGEELADDVRVDDGAARGDPVEGGAELGDVAHPLLEQVAHGAAGLDELGGVSVFDVLGQDQNGQARVGAP
jgi:hypothetical protein